MSKHTPGPWPAVTKLKNPATDEPVYLVGDSSAFVVCAKTEADAVLCRAAPLMEEALRCAADWSEHNNAASIEQRQEIVSRWLPRLDHLIPEHKKTWQTGCKFNLLPSILRNIALYSIRKDAS